MRTIKLMQLSIQDFKSISQRDIDFSGQDAVITGRNGQGKTSIYDALCWLLTGKDARGNQPESEGFEIKPRDRTGRVRDGVMPTVIGVFQVDGETITFKKTFKERWEKPRGAAEARFSGHTTEYEVDHIPRKESEYKRIVGELVGDDVFRILTDVYRFPAAMKWQERRKLLFELCGVQSDAEILAGNAKFKPLQEAAGRWSVDEYEQSIRSQRKAVNGSLELLPIRIDEMSKSVAQLREIDFDALEQQAAAEESHKRDKEAELYDITHNTALSGARNELDRLKNELAKLENENTAHRRSQETPVNDPRPAMQRELDMIRRDIQRNLDAAKAAEGQIGKAEGRLEQYREQWKTIHAEAYAGDETCPTCGQPLPAEQVNEAKRHFEQDKRARLSRLEADSDVVKAGMEDQKDVRDAALAQAKTLGEQEKELSAKLAATEAPAAPVVEDLPDYATRATELRTSIQGAEERIRQLETDCASRVQELKTSIMAAENTLSELRGEIAKKATIQGAETRIEELHAEQRSLAAELENLDSLLYLCKEFTRYKVDTITDEINSHFACASFRLFREQINGGLEDCCDVMLDGRPYGSISDGEKIKVGIDIIRTLSGYYGVHVPLFVDRAESVTDFPETDTQTIRLIVEDKELEITV